MALQTANYVDLLTGTADLCGLDRDNIGTADFAILRSFHAKRLQTAWEFELWPELMRMEKRYYRDVYATGTAYGAPSQTVPVEVYFPASAKYYQTLVATTGNDPADANGVTDLAHWAESQTSYTAANYAAGTTYLRGNQVYYPTTDRHYQLYAVSSVGNLPTDTTKWGVLTPFDRYISLSQTGKTVIGHVFLVVDSGPRFTTKTTEYAWDLTENGIQVHTASTFAWVNYRIRTPILKGTAYSATAIYTANSSQSYFSSTTTPGNFYDCIITTSAGQSPDTNPASWSIVNIPYIFRRYLEHGAYSDYLRNDGQGDKALIEDEKANMLLSDQAEVLTGAQQQARRSVVLTR